MSILQRLLDQYHAYLHLQHHISKAIYNRDESLLTQLRQASHDVFAEIEANRVNVLENVDAVVSSHPSFQSTLSQLAQLIEQSQQQVQQNEASLHDWLGQMKNDVKHFRNFRSQRGVLANYVQQDQASPSHITEFEEPAAPSDQPEPTSSATFPFSPWISSTDNPETVGHQVNQQS